MTTGPNPDINTLKKSHHPDLKILQKSRPVFDENSAFHFTQAPDVEWKQGQGANSSEWKNHKKISIDPYGEGRAPVDNYKTLISAVVPRPIGFVSSVSDDGNRNLAPFSFFNVTNTDPPIFAIGFSSVGGKYKDTCANILTTGELTINIVSEWFAEAVDHCAINAPSDVDEWELSGLTPIESEDVAPPHVAESAFSIEAKLVSYHEFKSKANPSITSGVTVIVEGIKFHAREDIINSDKNNVDVAKLRPVARLGGISYVRSLEGFELTRPVYEK